MTLSIPGYYYDAERSKYFKIEKSHTAPAEASWSSDAVKRRKTEHGQQSRMLQEKARMKQHIRRSGIWQDSLSDSLLKRELGLGQGDVGAARWAAGLAEQGDLGFGLRSDETDLGPTLRCFWAGAVDELSSVGVVYAAGDDTQLMGSFLPIRSDGRIYRNHMALRGHNVSSRLYPDIFPFGHQISSIKYHKGSDSMLITSREPLETCRLYRFRSPSGETGPEHLIGEHTVCERIERRGRTHVNLCVPAPTSRNQDICILGTRNGVVRLGVENDLHWYDEPSEHKIGEVFGLDYQAGNANVVFAGGRKGWLWMRDLRQRKWQSSRMDSSVNHVQSVNEREVLVSCLKNNLGVFDLRYLKLDKRQKGCGSVVTFPEHRNEAHIHTGLDISPSLGVIAAAQDNGTVKIFSLRTGRWLKMGHGGVHASRGVDGIKRQSPILAMQFCSMPGEHMEHALFVGEGLRVKKYSFGLGTTDGSRFKKEVFEEEDPSPYCSMS